MLTTSNAYAGSQLRIWIRIQRVRELAVQHDECPIPAPRWAAFFVRALLKIQGLEKWGIQLDLITIVIKYINTSSFIAPILPKKKKPYELVEPFFLYLF